MKIQHLGALVVVCFSLCGCAACKQSAPKSDAHVQLLRLTATVDGSDRIIFTRNNVHLEHKFWDIPRNVTLNGEPWLDLDRAPLGWRDFTSGLDLSKAWIVERQGRDVIALEQTSKGFDLYLCDTPNGADKYEATIAIPRRN